MEFQPDQTLSHYRLTEKIGSGGMGVVWSAHDTKLKRDVAIKILPPGLTSDHERKLRFQREAETAAGLTHPNIAVIHEVGDHEGTPYLVMELLRGKTLREVAGQRALPVRQWLELAVPIASALAYAHKNGIVHRDLKSANVMVTDDGHVKLLDFGLAKLLDPGAGDVADLGATVELATISRELTMAGTVLGTVAYMSPEQARGEEVDHRSDLFSLGVLLYELATGRFPFEGKTAVESLSATLQSEPRPITEIVADVPGEAGRIVAKALEKERQRRYQTAEDMVTDLRNLERDLGTGRVAIPGQDTQRTQVVQSAGGGGRNWLIGSVAAVVLVAGTFGVLSLRGSGDEATGPATTAAVEAPGDPAPERSRIVVLPFENQGATDDEYFAAGVTEEIIGRLASVADLQVISRSSSFQYDRTGKTMQQIGADFAVDYILDGTVRWARTGAGSRVRISPQLVRVDDDTGVWGETYDADMDDIFQVQTDIATQVIEALGLVLVAGHSATSDAIPTGNQEAYQAYLRGQDALLREPTGVLAQQMFERAVELDPDFAQAWAWLSRAHSWRYHGGDRYGNRCEQALDAAEEALRLAPDAPASRMALGLYYYRCFRDYERALAELAIAGRGRPNDTDVMTWKATLNKRQGNLEEAIRLNIRALEIDPMDHSSAQELGTCYYFNRQYAESIDAYERAISISPDVPGSYYFPIRVHLVWEGDMAAIRALLDRMPAGDYDLARVFRFRVEVADGKYDDALAIAAGMPDYFEDQTSLHPRAAYEAICHLAKGDAARARAANEEARKVLEDRVAADEADFRPYADLGPVYAALGMRDEAIAAARRAIELMPATKDAEAGVQPADVLALTYAVLGDYDSALTLAQERILVRPGTLSLTSMRLDPRWSGFRASQQYAELERRAGSLR